MHHITSASGTCHKSKLKNKTEGGSLPKRNGGEDPPPRKVRTTTVPRIEQLRVQPAVDPSIAIKLPFSVNWWFSSIRLLFPRFFEICRVYSAMAFAEAQDRGRLMSKWHRNFRAVLYLRISPLPRASQHDKVIKNSPLRSASPYEQRRA